jgi:hypothetical protein
MNTIRRTWARVAEMDWAERRTRLAQEVNKRLDLALHRAGLLSQRNGIGPYSSSGDFFFRPGEVDGRVALIKEHLPLEVTGIVQEADEICEHRFRLLGYDKLNYGAEIDWHLDAVHGKRAPAKPWFKINFLDFDEVGDHKIIWELNRHQHLVTLAKAWRFTGDPGYVVELQKQWYAWRRANIYPIGINWGSSLEVAFRSLSWLWVRALLTDCEVVSSDFRADMVRALAFQGRYIERYLSTYFSPNTHLLGEGVALFFLGILCPAVDGANRWKELGWRIVLDEAKRQVRADGVYFEQSLYYHVYALDFFLHARVLAERNGMEIPTEFDFVLSKMLDFLSTISASGATEGFGDDDGGRVFNPRRNRGEHMSDPLRLGASVFRGRDSGAASPTEEAVWLLGEKAISNFGVKPIGGAADSSFNDGGIYIMSSRENVPAQMVIDAGPQGTGRSGHGHADALSVSLSLAGRRWLVDPGTFCYVGEERDRFRGTGAHNTVRVDGEDQAIGDGPFGWKSIPEIKCERWIKGEGFSLFSGSHSGYLRLADPVLHRRQIFYLHDQFWLIRDVLEGREQHQIEINWHFAPDISIEKVGNGFLARSADGGLALLAIDQSGWKSSIENDFVSPAYGRKEPSGTVRLGSRAKLPTEYATVLQPSVEHAGTFSRVESGYCYESDGRRHYMIFRDDAGDWTWRDWMSDARYFYFCIEGGQLSNLILCDGHYLKLNGVPVLNHVRVVERVEWNLVTGQLSSPDDSVVESFSVEPLKSPARDY